MKSFGDWFGEFRLPEKKAGYKIYPEEEDLPYNIHATATPGKYMARCVCCDNWKELYCDIWEALEGPQYVHYCGGSPHCCP